MGGGQADGKWGGAGGKLVREVVGGRMSGRREAGGSREGGGRWAGL